MADAEGEGSAGTNILYKMILMSLCNNFNIYSDPMSESECQFKSQLQYDMMALRGQTLRLTTIDQMPLSGVTIDEKGNKIGTGVAFNMLQEIQDQLGFKYELILPSINEIGNTTHGVINLLVENKVDMAVMFFPMLKEYRQWVSFSDSLGEAEWVLLMKRPLASATGSGLLAPFETYVWVAILASLLVVGPVIYGLIVLRARICEEDDGANHTYSLQACIWFVYGALMKQGSTLSPVADSARILFATWWIFITILTSFYTANLTAFLTLSQFTLTIKDAKDIVAYKRYWVADHGGHTYEMINKADELQTLKATVPAYGQFIENLTADATYEAAKKDTIFVGERRKSIKLIQTDYLNKTERKVKESERCTYVLSTPFITKPIAFAYPKGGKLQKVMNPMLSYFVQGGIVDHLLNKPLPMTTICPLNLPSSERKLRNGDLKTTYYVVGVGFAMGVISFAFEVIFRWYKKKADGISINSGDIMGHILNQKGEKNFGHYNSNAQFGNVYSNGKANFGFPTQENKNPSTFLFQYTN